MAKNKRSASVGGGLLVALALAAICFNHPTSSWLVILGIGIFISLMYTVSGWYTKSGLSAAEGLGRFIAALMLCSAVAAAYTAQFWPPPPITVNPERVAFSGYPDETFNFSVRNGRSDDVYDVQIPFLIGYARHFDDKFSVKVMPNGEPLQRIYIRYNYCYGVKGDGVGSHVQPNEREVLIVHITHLPGYGNSGFSVTYAGGEKLEIVKNETPTFADEPTSYSPSMGTVGVRGDYRACKYAMGTNGGVIP